MDKQIIHQLTANRGINNKGKTTIFITDPAIYRIVSYCSEDTSLAHFCKVVKNNFGWTKAEIKKALKSIN